MQSWNFFNNNISRCSHHFLKKQSRTVWFPNFQLPSFVLKFNTALKEILCRLKRSNRLVGCLKIRFYCTKSCEWWTWTGRLGKTPLLQKWKSWQVSRSLDGNCDWVSVFKLFRAEILQKTLLLKVINKRFVLQPPLKAKLLRAKLTPLSPTVS